MTRPDLTEVPLTAIVAGDAVWSPDGQCFYFVDAAVGTGRWITFVYAGGTSAAFDLDQVRRILRADDPCAAELWNIERSWAA